MPTYTAAFTVEVTIEAVAEFHRDTRALTQLTPPPLSVSFNELQPLGEGSIADFTLWFGPIPIHWVSSHSNVHPTQGFTDTQISGPFDHWVHQHNFVPIDDNTTEIRDQIQAIPGRGLKWGLVSRFMWLNLPILFAYRARRTKQAVEAKRV